MTGERRCASTSPHAPHRWGIEHVDDGMVWFKCSGVENRSKKNPEPTLIQAAVTETAFDVVWKALGYLSIFEDDADKIVVALRAANMLREPGVHDAATAAIERAKALAKGALAEDGNAPHNDWNLSRDYLAKQVLAALDGSPEPDWEERLAACDKHGTHCWSCMRHAERRRPPGEWHRLPVEGESE